MLDVNSKEFDYFFDYDSYDKVANYVCNKMIELSRSFTADLVTFSQISPAASNIILYRISGNGKSWDIKPLLQGSGLLKQAKLKDSVGNLKKGSLFLFTPVRRDYDYLYFYDIWGNIAWGYIAASCFFTLPNLQAGNYVHNFRNDVLKEANSDDQLSVGIGFDLYWDRGKEVTGADIQNAIADSRFKFHENTTKVTADKLTLE